MSSYTVTNANGDVLLAHTMPEAEYMYGCTPTAVGMILGYYDLYGYDGADFSDIIPGDVVQKSRGTDGSIYNMNEFDTALGNAIASEDYVYRFFSRDSINLIVSSGYKNCTPTTPEEELEYSFEDTDDGPVLRTDCWNCIADYIGTGQYWRGANNLTTYLGEMTLEKAVNNTSTVTSSSGEIERKVERRFTTMLYGLYLYVEDKGYTLDWEHTAYYHTDTNGGTFTFEDFKAEIDAGRPVLISITQHSMVGYGYNAATGEIIFDDDYRANQRMYWNGTYRYADEDRVIQGMTVIRLVKPETGVFSGYVLSDGLLTVGPNQQYDGMTVGSGGRMYVSGGGSANSSFVSNGGSMYVFSNGLSFETTVSAWGIMRVCSSGTAYGTILESAATVYLYDDGEAYNTTVGAGGLIRVYSSGLAYDTTIESGGCMFLYEDGVAHDTTVGADGTMHVYQNGSLDGLSVESGGTAHIYENAGASHASASCGGGIFVYGGAEVREATVESDGFLNVYNDGAVSDTVVSSAGSMYVGTRGTASGTVVSEGGRMYVSGGGTASDTIVTSGGFMFVSYGGTATDIVENGGYVNVRNGANVTFVPNEFAGLVLSDTSATIHSGTTATEVVVESGGLLVVSYGGEATDVVESGGYVDVLDGANVTFVPNELAGFVLSDASATIHSGTIASDTTVSSGGSMYLFDGGVMTDTMIESGGGVFVASGGKLTGRMDFRRGAFVSMDSGAILDFDLTQAEADEPALLNDYSVISGDPTITLTVDGVLEDGTYRLAENASRFNQTITVVDSSGTQLGAVPPGLTMDIGGVYYSVNVADGALIVTLGENGGSTDSGTFIGSGSRTVYPGQTSSGLVVTSGGKLIVSSGGRVYDTTVSGYQSDSTPAPDPITDLGLHLLNGAGANDTSVSGYYAFCFVSSGATAGGLTVYSDGRADVSSGGRIIRLAVKPGGWLNICSGGVVNDAIFRAGGTGAVISGGGKLTGHILVEDGAVVTMLDGAVLDFDFSYHAPEYEPRVEGLSGFTNWDGTVFTLTVDQVDSDGVWTLADGAEGFDREITVQTVSGRSLGTLTVGGPAVSGDGVRYTLNLDGSLLTVSTEIEPPPPPYSHTVRSDVDGNGISDVMFVWTGEHGEGNCQHGYWMNGASDWRSENASHPAEWENLGCHDMTGDGMADSVLVGNVEINGVKGAYIGYYADARDYPDGSTWVNIGYLNNADDIDWKNTVGNLSGGVANSIVWFAPELYALGTWTDGTDNWTSISSSFGGDDWALVGCGDFDGDGRDSVVMSGLGGQYYYTADVFGNINSMGSVDWSGWDVRAIGDFAGDGKDDLVLFHKEYGTMVILADGNLEDFNVIGQLDAADWFVVGAGDYNGDQHDDLLVRQYSTGMLGYYSAGDTTQWNVLGYGVDMSWTVIA